MGNPIENYWNIRLLKVKESLENNRFDVHIVNDRAHVKKIVSDEIISKMNIAQISRGGSKTVETIGIDSFLLEGAEYIDPFRAGLTFEQRHELMRKALLSDLYITGTNSITEDGKLVNLDSIGNRVGGITFGPEVVIIVAGRNKIDPDVESAMQRIKDYAAPVNAMKLGKKTPCVKTSACMDCSSPERICNAWSIIEKSNPKGRIKIFLINEDLGD